MLRKLGKKIDDAGVSVRVADASFPTPFLSQLEFNAPVHGAWNIVHVGMLVPECHQIYVCADNCMRGVVLTAAEMGASDRFSCVLLEEGDLFEGNLEKITVEGISDAISRLPYRPRAVAVFLVCLHHFVGTDTAWVYRTLEDRFPDIDFMRCWMDPVMRKSGLAPEQKLKDAMLRPIRPLQVRPDLVCDLGDNQPLDPGSGLALEIRKAGFTLLQLHDCASYGDYLRMGSGALFITRSPSGIQGVSHLAARLGRPFLYLPPACSPAEIREALGKLQEQLAAIRANTLPEDKEEKAGEKCSLQRGPEAGFPKAREEGIGKESSLQRTSVTVFTDNTEERIGKENSIENKVELEKEGRVQRDTATEESAENAQRALAHARALLGDTEITIDHFATPRPLSLARLLLENGFHVTRVYLDAVSGEEEADFRWLQAHCPDLVLNATVHPKMRVLHARENEGTMLAIGPKAAWFGGTSHFVNIVETAGLWGFEGIARLAVLIEDAFLNEKDTRSIVPRKGFGCTCIL